LVAFKPITHAQYKSSENLKYENNFQCNSPSFSLTGLTKLLVGAGATNDIIPATTEIIDLQCEASVCQNFGTLLSTMGAVGGLGFDDKPLICGGLSGTNRCYSWEDSDWRDFGFFERLFRPVFLNRWVATHFWVAGT